jgi:hypothetical protein
VLLLGLIACQPGRGILHPTRGKLCLTTFPKPQLKEGFELYAI